MDHSVGETVCCESSSLGRMENSNLGCLLKPALGMIDTTCDKISMEEEIASESSNAFRNGAKEVSDSNSNCSQFRPNKRLKPNQEPYSPRFKGVVLQQNGHWGAQIYAKHQRIWLGTFKSETAAAMAYDSASTKLRSSDTHRNFPWNTQTLQEPNFQELYSIEAVLNMIKDGSYESKFAEFVKTQCSNPANKDLGSGFVAGHDLERRVLYQQLFQKELKPSDVGKLNRLVIPKKHATRFFGSQDTDLVFFDDTLRSWKFKYRYWASSQSFVFTRGWTKFVKEKEVKARDVIFFYRCERREGAMGGEIFYMICVDYTKGGFGGGFGLENGGFGGGKVQLGLGFDGGAGCGSNGERLNSMDLGRRGSGSDLGGSELEKVERGSCGLELEGHRLVNVGRDICGLEMEGHKWGSLEREGCGLDLEGHTLLNVERGGCGIDLERQKWVNIVDRGDCGSKFAIDRGGGGLNLRGQKLVTAEREAYGLDFGGYKLVNMERGGGGLDLEGGLKLGNIGRGCCGSDLGWLQMTNIGRDGGGSDLDGYKSGNIKRFGCESDLEGQKSAYVEKGGCGLDSEAEKEAADDANSPEEEKCVRLFGAVIS